MAACRGFGLKQCCPTRRSGGRAGKRCGPEPARLEHMLEELRNLGPKSEAMLRHSGITSVEQLRELGAVRAYVKVKCNDAGASLNLLWALEGALSNRPWQEVAKQDRLSLLMQVEEIEKADRSASRSSK